MRPSQEVQHRNDRDDQWIALGVQQHIMQRVLSSLCHDMAGHVSVVRMIGMVFNLQLKKDDLPRDSLLEGAASLSSEVTQAAATVKLLRSLCEPNRPAYAPDECVTTVLSLMKTPARVAGHHVTALPAPVDATPGDPLPATTLLALAGLICRAQERATGPSEIEVRRIGSGFEVSTNNASAPAGPVFEARRDRHLDDPRVFGLFLAQHGYNLLDSGARQQMMPIKPTHRTPV